MSKEFFDKFGLGRPVVEAWYYDGYYEDFNWESELKPVAKWLKKNKMTIEELDAEIQKAKKTDKTYDVSTDSVVYADLRVSSAFMDYPIIDSEGLINLICLLKDCEVDELEKKVCSELMEHPELKEEIELALEDCY